jgi:hypothetical protein
MSDTARLLIREGGVVDGEPLGDTIVLALDGEAARAVASLLRVEPPANPFHCMCRGDYAVELIDAAGRRLSVVGLHHGVSVRVHGWPSDALLADPEALLTELAQRGLRAPLDAWLAAEEQRRAWDAEARVWNAAMPPLLRPRLAEIFALGSPRPLGDPAWQPAVAALLDEVGGDRERAAAALIDWLAVSRSPWSPSPAYEGVALTLLDLLGPAALAGAVIDHPQASAGWLRAAARAAAQLSTSRREIREALAPIADRLRGALSDGDEQARLEAVLRPPPSGQRSGGMNAAGVTQHAPACSLAATDGGEVYALDGDELVRFELGPRRVLMKLQGPYGYFFADERGVLALDWKAQRVSILQRDGSARVLAENQDRPFYPRLVGDRAFWLACPFVTGTDGYSHQKVHLRSALRHGGEVATLLVGGEENWSFQPTVRGVYFLASEKSGLLRRERCRLKRVDLDGSVHDLVRADGAEALLAWDGGLVWRAGAEVTLADFTGERRRRLCRVESIRAWAGSERGLAVIASRDDSNARTLAEISWDGAVRQLASFTEQHLSTEVVATSAGIYFNLAHDVLRL